MWLNPCTLRRIEDLRCTQKRQPTLSFYIKRIRQVKKGSINLTFCEKLVQLKILFFMKRYAKILKQYVGAIQRKKLIGATNARKKNQFREASVHMYSACTGLRERGVRKQSVYVGSTTCVQRQCQDWVDTELAQVHSNRLKIQCMSYVRSHTFYISVGTFNCSPFKLMI